jgi:3-dehydroquinate dehydratase-2
MLLAESDFSNVRKDLNPFMYTFQFIPLAIVITKNKGINKIHLYLQADTLTLTILPSMKLLILNGPNLNLLGTRETSVYGNQPFADYFKTLQINYSTLELVYYQSNVEGDLINKLHEVGFSYDGIILNAGGYTHTSVALRDAIAAIKTPTVEVHISNVFAREDFRHVSLIAPKCKGSISGFGMDSYRLAIESFIN